MRFDEMKRHYPFIYQFFEQVAGQVHAGATAEMSMGSLRREIDSKIRQEHREAVTGKLTRWAQLVEENNRTIDIDRTSKSTELPTFEHPSMCPYCSSIEMQNGICSWCNRNTEKRRIEMKAITLWQPWASLAAIGVKPHETRSWTTNYRGPIAIHAATKRPTSIWGVLEPIIDHIRDALGIVNPDDLPRGAVVATANLVECWKVIKHTPTAIVLKQSNGVGEDKISIDAPYLKFGDYSVGRYIWALADIKMLPEPIPAKGQQGLWEWEMAL